MVDDWFQGDQCWSLTFSSWGELVRCSSLAGDGRQLQLRYLGVWGAAAAPVAVRVPAGRRRTASRAARTCTQRQPVVALPWRQPAALLQVALQLPG